MDVLLGVDGSDLSLRALEEATRRARTAGDRVTVAVYEGSSDATRDDVVATVRDRLASTGIEAEIRAIDDDPGSTLVELAERGYDRIVIGGGTRSPLGKVQLGPVAEFVILNANTSVTLVR